MKKYNKVDDEVSQTTRKKIERIAEKFNVKIEWEHMHGNCQYLGFFEASRPGYITIRTNHPDQGTPGYDEDAQYRMILRHELCHRVVCLTGKKGDTCAYCDYVDDEKLCKKLGI